MNISTYCHIQAANVHALLMTIPSRAGTKPKVLTSSTDDLKCVMSTVYNGRPTKLSSEP